MSLNKYCKFFKGQANFYKFYFYSGRWLLQQSFNVLHNIVSYFLFLNNNSLIFKTLYPLILARIGPFLSNLNISRRYRSHFLIVTLKFYYTVDSSTLRHNIYTSTINQSFHNHKSTRMVKVRDFCGAVFHPDEY